jgi:tryptophan 2,3-dioxygenase
MTGDPIQLLSTDEFAEKIKSKYPEYQDMDNLELATKIIEKYPEYADQVDLKKKDEGMDLPLADGFSVLSESEEIEFQNFMNTNPDVIAWKEQFVEKYKEEPQIDGANYDYRGAWKAGLTPSVSEQDGLYHWGSKGLDGVNLKSDSHPTRWKSDYMEITGKDPDVENISKEEALLVIEKNKKEWKVRYESVFDINPDEYGIEEEEGTNQLAAYEIQQQEGIKLHDRLKPPTDRYSEAIDEVGRILNTTKPKEAVELLDRLFKDSGFSFEQEGVEVKMIAPNKNELVVQTKKRMKPSRFGLPISPIMQKHLHTATDQQTIQDFYETNRPQEEYNPNVAVSAKDLDNMVFSFRNAEDALIQESLALQEEGNTFRQDPRHYWNPYKIKQNPVEYKEFLAQRQEIKNQAEDLDARWKKLEEDRLKVMDMEKERNEMLAFTDYSDKKNYGDKFLADFAGVGSGSNFLGRMWHAAALGRGQSGSVDELGKVWTQVFYGKANEVSEDDINNMREAMKEAQQYGPSETMQNWYTRMNKYREEGLPGLLAMVRATAADPESLPDLMATSFAMLTNPYIMKRGAAAFSAVHSVATGVGAFGSAPGVGITNLAALPYSIPTAMLAMTATLETTLTFGQLLEEELGGIDNMTVENVQRLFNNEYKMKRFVNRSLGRGIAIGAVEAFAMALGIKVAPRVANMMGAGMRGKMAAMTTVSGIDVFGGSLGEVSGMAMAGQDYIGEDIYLEGIGALWNAPITYGVGMAYSPKYKVNGQEWTAADFKKWINDPETSQDAIAGATIDIKNDNAMARFVEQKKATAFKEGVIAKSLDPITENLPKAAREKLVRLEMELQDLKEKGEGTETSKMRIKEIKDEIRIINEAAKGTKIFEFTFTDEQGNEVKERVEVSEEYAIEQLKKDGIDTPTSEQIKTKQQELVDQGKRALQEKYKGVEQTQLTAEEKEVADLLGLDLSGTETTEDVTENFQVNNKGQVKDLSIYAKFVDQATKASNAIKALLPNVKLILHTTEAEYKKYTGDTNRGKYVSDGKQGAIHLNAAKMIDSTVGHEIFHAIVDQVFRGSQEALTEFTNTMIEQVKPFLSKADITKLEKFSEGYKDGLISEEQLSELFGDLAGNYKNLNIGAKNRVKKFLLDIANLISKKLGDFVRPYLQTDTGVIDMLNALSTKVSAGATITKEDVVMLKGEGRKKRGPLSRDQQKDVETEGAGKKKTLYTGSPKSFDELGDRTGLVYLTPSKEEANEYAGNRGRVIEIEIDESSIASEKVLLDTMKDLDIDTSEGLTYELIDPRFKDFYIGKENVNKVISQLKERGFKAAEYTDGSQLKSGTVQNVVVFDKSSISEKEKKGKAAKPQEWTFRDQKVGTEATLFDYVRAGKLGNVSTKDLISVLVKKGIGHTNIKQQLIDSGIKKPTLKQIQKKQREEIKKILKISDKELTNLPSVFGSLNIGPVAGNRLFKSLTREKKGKPVLTIEQALEKLRSSQAYKNATDSQKTEMETAVRAQHELGTPREMTDRIKEARHLIRDLDSYRSLQDFKRKLKTFVRKALPLDVLKTNKRVEELLAKIDKIKHSDLDTITEEIIEEVNTINSRTLNRDIDTALKDLSKKNKPLSSKIKKWISAVDPSASIKSILAEVDKLIRIKLIMSPH